MTDDKPIDVEIDGIRRETAKAYLVVIGKREEWVPKSLAKYNAADSTITLPEWIAKEKGLI